MFKSIKIFLLIMLAPVSTECMAENKLVDGNMFYAIPDAGSSDDFHTGKILSVNYNYYLLPWLAASAGLYISEEIFDDTGKDIVGTFKTSLKTQGIALGIRPEYKLSERNRVYARVGYLYYDSKLRVEEFFQAGLPTGSSAESTTGNGYFIALAWAHSFNKTVSFQLELNHQKQLDLFDGKTSPDRVFDLGYSGFSLGLGYAF